MTSEKIDKGNPFDWGKAADDYAKYRDIYPKEFYDALHFFGVGKNGQRVLDIGTGSGVLLRNIYKFGGEFYGIDIAPEQIENAKALAEPKNLDISFSVGSAENINFPDNFFDTVIAVQCWKYFNKEKAIPEIKRVLKQDGEMIIAFLSWLPDENEIVRASFDIVRRFNPNWNGYDCRTQNHVPPWVQGNFRMTTFHAFDVSLHFTSESWNGRMKASRGIGATLISEQTEEFGRQHLQMLEKRFGKEFDISHEIVIMKFKTLGG